MRNSRISRSKTKGRQPVRGIANAATEGRRTGRHASLLPDGAARELLGPALSASGDEIRSVVREIDKISRTLQEAEQAATTEYTPAYVHPAVWCAIRHLMLERELRQMALTDDLTQLYNRRGFFATASQQLKVARRKSETLMLLFCDINDFKKINDNLGHSEGDHALMRTAQALTKVFRDADILARLGGDEFAVLATDASRENQAAIFARLEETVRKANKRNSRYELSLSIGVAWFDPKKPATLSDLLTQADREMYERKRAYRERNPLRVAFGA